MFRKANPPAAQKPAQKPAKARELIPTLVTEGTHLLGNMVSDGAVDFSGQIDGNIRCETLTLRASGTVKGEIVATTVHIHGTVKGLIRAKNVHLMASCKVEGIIIHEQLSIEDGAFVDGKFKRSDRVDSTDSSSTAGMAGFMADDEQADFSANTTSNLKVLENIRLIR